ncbi:tetratricopeptide repeat protein [Vibrio natriegens]|uniref:tetratricopeptide repeat protein n=1 Tax=Vibrio natriegens TaxID=691 RepID=UPI001EFD522D|nr:tetratricopeptide repeat protein [Vibrio natriegens]MCG9700283.1 tetratricopeptide repeat protein [Vibrio natriegens]
MRKVYILTLFVLLTNGCATSDSHQTAFDKSLYSGKPVEALTNDEPPANESEAITRGDAALTSNNTDLALYEYIRSLTFEDGVHKDKTLYTIGRIHETRGDFELADKAYRASLAENPNHIGSLEELGKLYTKQGRKDVGQSYYLRALSADQLRLGGTGNITMTGISSENILSLRYDEKSPANAYTGLGVLYDINNKHEIAQAFLRKALDIKPYNESALVSLGYSYYMAEDYGKASHFTNAALGLNNSNEKAVNNLGLIAIAKGEPRKALSIFGQHMSPSEALNSVGYFLILRGEPGEAIPYLQQAIDKSPSYFAKANENLERALAMVRSDRDTSKVFLQ